MSTEAERNNDESALVHQRADGPILARPRLLDLLVLISCLSLFLGLCRYAFGSEYNFALYVPTLWEVLGYGIGIACCWTGVFRLLRPDGGPRPLPAKLWQPGEVICAVEGGYYLLVAAIGSWLRMVVLDGRESLPEDMEATISYAGAALFYLAAALPMSLGYAWMARHVTVRAWRIAAVAKVVGHAGGPFLLLILVADWPGVTIAEIISGSAEAISVLLVVSLLVPTLLVAWAAYKDRQRTGVHWTHWLGLFAFGAIYCSRLSLEIRVFADFFAG